MIELFHILELCRIYEIKYSYYKNKQEITYWDVNSLKVGVLSSFFLGFLQRLVGGSYKMLEGGRRRWEEATPPRTSAKGLNFGLQSEKGYQPPFRS